MRDFDVTGVWWRPGAQGGLTGTLTCRSSQFPRLELFGAFDQQHPSGVPVPMEGFYGDEPILLGVTSTNQRITLHRAVVNSIQHRFPGPQTSTYLAVRLILGAHIEDEDHLRFAAIRTRLHVLEEWIGSYGFGPMRLEEDEQSVSIRYRQSPRTLAALEDGTRVEIADVLVREGAGRDVALQNHLVLEVMPPEPRPLTDLLELEWRVRTLLSVLTGNQLHSANAKVRAPWADEEPFDEDRWLDLIYPVPVVRERSLISHQLAPSRRVLGFLPDMITKWCRETPSIDPVLELAMGWLGDPGSSLEKFFKGYRAIEAYVRLRHKLHYMPPDEFGEIQKRIAEAVPSEIGDQHRKRLLGSINFSNEYSLRDQLAHAIDLVQEALPEGARLAGDQFLADCLAIRHYRTHFDKRRRSRAEAAENRISEVNDVLGVLLGCLLLGECGLSESDISSLLAGNQTIARLAGGSLGSITVTRGEAGDAESEGNPATDEDEGADL